VALWCETTALIVRDGYDDAGSAANTLAAERALGIDEDCWYWFIGRPDAAFGYGIFVFEVDTGNADPTWLGVSPFDSGGLFGRWIATNPSLDDPHEKRAFFATVHYPIAEWQDRFELYLSQNYDSVSEYVKGRPPRVGVPPIVSGPPNTQRAWTWEGHIHRSRVAALVRLVHVYLSRRMHERFQQWVAQSPYDAPVRSRILALMEDRSRVTVVSRHTEAEAATEFLVRRYGTEPTRMEAQP
jgi:hypothetical protein